MDMDTIEEPVMPEGGGTQADGDVVTSLYEWVEAAVFSLVCVALVFAFVLRIVGVDGTSMTPTLMNHDRLVLVNCFYEPKQGDIVVINRYTQEPLVKRVIAVAGQTIEITDEGQVLIDGSVLDEPYINALTEPGRLTEPYTVKEGQVCVMGDNRHPGGSHDSRADALREINVRDIMGKAVFRIWPLSDIGGLYEDQ